MGVQWTALSSYFLTPTLIPVHSGPSLNKQLSTPPSFRCVLTPLWPWSLWAQGCTLLQPCPGSGALSGSVAPLLKDGAHGLPFPALSFLFLCPPEGRSLALEWQLHFSRHLLTYKWHLLTRDPLFLTRGPGDQ